MKANKLIYGLFLLVYSIGLCSPAFLVAAQGNNMFELMNKNSEPIWIAVINGEGVVSFNDKKPPVSYPATLALTNNTVQKIDGRGFRVHKASAAIDGSQNTQLLIWTKDPLSSRSSRILVNN